jgi:uncharacterized membrane protein
MPLSLPAPLKTAASRMVRFGDRVGEGLGRAGLGALVWPLSVGMGVGIGLFGLVEPRLFLGIYKPRATLELVHRGLKAVGISVAASVLTIALVAFIRKRRGDPRSFGELSNATGRSLAFLTGLPFAVALKEPLEDYHDWVALAFATAASAFVVCSAYEWFSDAPVPSAKKGVLRRLAPVAVGVLVVAYAGLASFLSIANHLGFYTGRADLGIYVNIFSQSSQGIPLGCSLCGGSHTTGHFDPILVLLSPIYLLYRSAETILILQSVWLAAGAIPVYLLARRRLEHRLGSVALAASYLLFPALHGANLFDFHSLTLCIPLLLFLLYFLETGSKRLYYLTLVLLLLVREDLAIALALVGITALFSREPDRVRLGWVTIFASAAYFLLAKSVFMGRIDPLNATPGARSGYAYYYEELIPKGSSTAGLLGTLVTDPIYALTRVLTEPKLDYVAKLCVPLLGLPLVGRGRLQYLYGAALTLLASRPFLATVHFHYSSLLVPPLFACSIAALGAIREGEIPLGSISGVRLSRALSIGVLVCSLLCSWKFGGLVPNRSFQAGFHPQVRTLNADQLAADAWLKQVARSLPRGARVAANSRLLPHLGALTNVFLLEDRAKAEYVIANMQKSPLATAVAQDVAKGHLVELKRLKDLRLYKANWAGQTPVAARQNPKQPADDE